jgi:crotonobetaine/carnitine-CoA ligase
MTRFADLAGTPLRQRTLTSVLESALSSVPDKIALREPDRALSYAQTWQSALRLAGGFQSVGVVRHDRVLIMLENHLDNVLTWLALSLFGAVEVPINTSYMGEMLSYLVNDSGAGYAVVDRSLLGQFASIAGELRHLHTVIVRDSQEEMPNPFHGPRTIRIVNFEELASHAEAAPEVTEPWDLAAVVYTSGTTGRSKGVLAPHAHAWHHASGVGTTDADDVRFVVLPQFHITGQWGGVYRSLMAEATAFVAPSFHVSTFWDEVRAIGATTTQLVGTMAAFINAQPTLDTDHQNPLREVYMIPVLPEVGKFSERFGVAVYSQYGTTEVGGVLVNPDAVRNPGMGHVVPGYEVRLVDEHDIEVPVGQVGEIVVRSDQPWTTMLGYQGEPQKSADAFRNGWLHSGDAAYKDQDGRYFFADRIKDAIRRRGENVSSLEVELHINQHPSVVESAVVAVPSEHLEDEIRAVVVLREDTEDAPVSEEDLFKYLAERLPYFMVPRFIEFRSELPKTPTEKIRKADLRSEGSENAWDSKEAGFVVNRGTAQSNLDRKTA